MNDEPLPSKVDPRKLAAKGAVFESTIAVSALPRFASAVHEQAGEVTIKLEFGVDEQRIRYIQGELDASTQVICQRCMEPLGIKVHADVNLAVAWDEIEAQGFPKSYDPLIVGEDEWVDLNEIVEDELLLELPFVSYHQPQQCGGRQRYESFPKEPVVQEKKENPFKVLETLKSDKQ